MNEKSAVVAVLTHDAARLPCGIVLPATSAELSLTAVGPALGATCLAGNGRVSWPGPDGPVVVEIVREWPVVRISHGRPVPSAVRTARTVLDDAGLEALQPPSVGSPSADSNGGDLRRAPPDLTRALTAAHSASVAHRLLGHGPGLTPSGDDLLAGLLLGCLAFGLDAGPLRDAVDALAPRQTTALSTALLGHAARGECIPEMAALAAAMAGRGKVGQSAARLLKVGHTSGSALALGLVRAAEYALTAATIAAAG